MKCNNCGASIDENLLLCPYCSFENEKIAEKQQEDYVAHYKYKIRELDDVPDKMVNRTNKYIIFVAIGISILFVIGLIIFFIVGNFNVSNKLKTREEHLEILGNYYADEEYSKISEYVETNELFGATYEKYCITSNIYSRLNDIMEELNERYVSVENSLWHIFDELNELDELKGNNYKYDEERIVEYAIEQYSETLKNRFMLTDDEIENITKAHNKNTDYSSWANIIEDRMMK